jgi:hypothetical protein
MRRFGLPGVIDGELGCPGTAGFDLWSACKKALSAGKQRDGGNWHMAGKLWSRRQVMGSCARIAAGSMLARFPRHL